MCKISVLMPVYNAERYLAKAIDSIINQTFNDWELLIINDGSTDSSKSIIAKYTDVRIHYLENETNLGLIKTLNKGIELCKGEYIARMDSDDVALPQRLAFQVQFMDDNPDYVMCGTNATVVDSEGLIVGKIVNPSQNTLLQISLLFTNPFVHPSMLIRKEVLVHHLFDEKWVHVEDFELWTRLARQGKIANLKEPLLEYRWHNDNVSNIYSEMQEGSKNEIVRQQLKRLNINPSDKELELHRLTFTLYSLGQKNKMGTDEYRNIGYWFQKLKEQNRLESIYPSADFEAFLWSRWIVLCVSQGTIRRALFSSFISYSPSVIYKTLQLIAYLRKK